MQAFPVAMPGKTALDDSCKYKSKEKLRNKIQSKVTIMNAIKMQTK